MTVSRSLARHPYLSVQSIRHHDMARIGGALDGVRPRHSRPRGRQAGRARRRSPLRSTLCSPLTDAEAIEAVYEGTAGLLSERLDGRLVIDMSTIRPETERALAERVGGRVLPSSNARSVARWRRRRTGSSSVSPAARLPTSIARGRSWRRFAGASSMSGRSAPAPASSSRSTCRSPSTGRRSARRSAFVWIRASTRRGWSTLPPARTS